MTSGQKVAFSLLISVLAFCAFTVVAFSGLFDLLEVNFYQPVVQEIKEKKISEIATAQNEYFQTLMKRFDSFILSDEVKTYADIRPSDSDAKKRELRRSQLAEATSSLKGIRIVAENGRNVYFSTFSSDLILGKKGITYKNYDGMDEISYESLSSDKSLKISDSFEKKCRIIKDGDKAQLIFSVPFFNSKDEYSGTALFYCDSVGFSQFLLNRNLIDVSGFARLVTASRNKNTKSLDNFGGFVFGMPNFGQNSLKNQILEKWRSTSDEKFWKLIPEENPELAKDSSEKVLGGTNENLLCVFSHKAERDDFGFISFMYDESELKFPHYMRILLLVTAFVTLYLAVFLILSFRHDDIVVIRDKVRRYENEFFIGYKKMGDAKNPAYLAEQKPVLERRILKSLGRKGEKHASEFKSIFEGYWNEMLASFGDSHVPAGVISSSAPMINADELKEIVRSSLEDILENGKIQINATAVKEVVREEKAESREQIPENVLETDEVEPVEEVEEAELAEEIESVEEVAEEDEIESLEEIEDAEPAEDVENAESVEEIEPVEEVADADDVESLEDVEPAEEVENAETVEKVESLEEPEEPDEIPEIAEVDDIELAEDAEPIEEIEEVSEPEEIESVEEVADADDVESLEDVEPAEEIEEVESAEELEDVEPVEDAESSEEIEDAESTEEIEEIGDAEEVAEADEVKSLEDVEEIEEIEEIEEAESSEDIENAESVEEIEEVADADEIESLEDVELAEEAEPAEDVEEIADAEEVDEVGDVESLEDVEPVEEVSEPEEVEPLEEIDDAEPADELEALEEIPEIPAVESESAVSEELEPIADLDEELKFGDGRIENDDELKPEFHTVTKEHLAQKFDEELEMLPEVSEHEELAIDIARTLAALPEQAPRWEDNDEVELDSEGLTRKPSYSELHDIQKLKDVAKVMDEKDAELEELEIFDPEKQNAKQTSIDTDYYAPHIMDNNIRPDDDIYKDEALLEKIEFGVPTTEIAHEVLDDSVADNFTAVQLDYSFLDDDDLDEKLYGAQTQQENVENDHFFTNDIDSAPESVLEEPEELEEVKILEEDTLATPDVADNIEEAEELESLEEPEENMPFMFTKFASATNADLPELSLDTDDAIVQDNDGTFRVTKWSQPDGRLPLDMDFKRLVDSIMH